MENGIQKNLLKLQFEHVISIRLLSKPIILKMELLTLQYKL